MDGERILRDSQIIILGVCIAAATIMSSLILSRGFLEVMRFSREQISVTGSARMNIKSDYIAWSGSFSRRDADLGAAYKRLEEDLVKVKAYLVLKGVREMEITVSQVSTAVVYRKNEKGNDTNEIQGYLLSRDVEIRSAEVDRIDRVSREATELISQGIEFVSAAPEYTYTRLDELKVEILARASENAKQRAESMVRATGNKIGFMRSARMGVFQITPVNSTEVSDWGVNDTSALEKKVTAVVTASFAIE